MIRAAHIAHVTITKGLAGGAEDGALGDFKNTQGDTETADEMLREAARLAAQRPALSNVCR